MSLSRKIWFTNADQKGEFEKPIESDSHGRNQAVKEKAGKKQSVNPGSISEEITNPLKRR